MKKWVCAQCGWQSAKWYGRCPECGNWEIEETEEKPGKKGEEGQAGKIYPSPDLSAKEEKRIYTGFSELDRVLGGVH